MGLGLGHQGRDLVGQPVQHPGQGRALLAPRRRHLVQGRAERGAHGGLHRGQGLGILSPGVGLHHAAQGQQPVPPRRRDPPVGHQARPRRQIALHHIQIDPHPARALDPLGGDVDGELPPLEPGLRALPRQPLQPVEARRPPEPDLQVAPVDAPRLHGPGPLPGGPFSPPEPGHSR